MKWYYLAFATPAVGLLVLSAVNCGTADRPPGVGDNTNPYGDATVSAGPCTEEGAVRACHAVTAQHPGYVDCFSGEQTCTNGEWSPCLGGPAGGTIWTRAYTPNLQPAEESPGPFHFLSLSPPVGSDGGVCAVDICNPSCQGFNEQPDAAITPTPGCIITYPDAGNISDAAGMSSDSSSGIDGGTGDAGCVTTVSGTVYDPGVNAPLPYVAVYQPTGPLVTFPAGVTCQNCSSLLSPHSTIAYSGIDGTFRVQVSGTTGIKLVIQTGKWRRQITVPGTLTACADNPIKAADGGPASDLTRLPKNASEGDIPLTAIAMATHEPAECLMLKILGGDTTEFGAAGSTKRIQLYNGTGNTFTGATAYTNIWASQASINAYDQVLLPCLGGTLPNLTAAQKGYFATYGNSGGRMFLNHKSADYTTSNNASDNGLPPWDTLFTYNPSVAANTQPIAGPVTGANGRVLNAAAPAVDFKTWLAARGAYSGGTSCNPANATNTICTPDPYLMPTNPIGTNAFEWVRGANSNDWTTNTTGNFNLSYSFDLNDAGVTPTLGADGGAGAGCGRVIVNSMHVDTARATTTAGSFPSACTNGLPMSPNEFMFEYLLFELSACSIAPPPPSSPIPPPPSPTIGPPSQPVTYTNTYTMGPCPMGQVGQWDTLGYNVSTPTGTEIKLAVQTSPEGGAGTWSPEGGSPAGVLVADIPLDHPGGNDAGVPGCTISGPSPCGNNCAASVGSPATSACPASCSCPINVGAKLSQLDAGLSVYNARQPVLEVNATLIPSAQSCVGVWSPGLLTTGDGTNGNACVNGSKDINGGACTKAADCQEDWRCASGNCTWNGNGTWFDPACKDKNGFASVDLTIGVPCAAPAADGGLRGWEIPICNRGSALLPAGSEIAITGDGNGSQKTWTSCNTSAPPMAAVSCRYNLQKDLWPGSCIEIDTSQPSVAGGGPPWPNGGQCGILEQGHRTLYVNYDLSTNTQPIAECGDGNGTGSGCDNNMSDTKTNGSGCGVGGSNSCGAPPPTTPQLPGLSNWSVTYSCVPAE